MKAPGADPMCTSSHVLLLLVSCAVWCVSDYGVSRLFELVSVSVLCTGCDPSQGAQLRHEQLYLLSGLHGRDRALCAFWPVWRV
uniref:RxLR effector candidate protein n=1 Tax=Hyaloperonospora arabidopsidis (strain Emoy2) TaxID=559515 RepID=M4BRL2_HYAAE